MLTQLLPQLTNPNGLIGRTIRHDSLRRGVGTLVASLIFAFASEALWPSSTETR